MGEEFTKNENQKEFRIKMPGAKNGSKATVRVRLVHTGVVQASANVSINGEDKGIITLPAVRGEECAKTGEEKWNFTVIGEAVAVKINYNNVSSNGHMVGLETGIRGDRRKIFSMAGY